MMAIIATKEGGRRKVYLAETDIQHYIPNSKEIESKIDQLCIQMQLTTPEEPLPVRGTLGFRIQAYGMLKWKDLFTPRQLLALLTFTAEVHYAHTAMLEEGIQAERATAITTYLAFMVACTSWLSRGKRAR